MAGFEDSLENRETEKSERSILKFDFDSCPQLPF